MNTYGRLIICPGTIRPARCSKISGTVYLSGTTPQQNALVTVFGNSDQATPQSFLNIPAGNITDTATGDIAWSNVANAGAEDGVFATAVTALSSKKTDTLKWQSWGFNIPSGATILGILVEIKRKALDATSASDNTVQLLKSGASVGSNKPTGGFWGTTLAWQSYGGANNLWGAIWTPQDINNANFGLILDAIFSNTTLSVDAARITIYFGMPQIVGVKETDVNGNYSFDAGYAIMDDRLYHVTAEYDSGSQKYNSPSQPYITPVGNP